jgi:hypothetical protein
LLEILIVNKELAFVLNCLDLPIYIIELFSLKTSSFNQEGAENDLFLLANKLWLREHWYRQAGTASTCKVHTKLVLNCQF